MLLEQECCGAEQKKRCEWRIMAYGMMHLQSEKPLGEERSYDFRSIGY